MVMVVPDTFRRMRDSFGKHKVRIYYDTRILREMLRARLDARKKYKEDSIYLVCGAEGSSKSTLTLHALDLYDELTGETTPIDNVTRNVEELMSRISVVEREKFLTMDEGSELSGERYTERNAKNIKEKFTVMRERAFIIFVCFTNPLKVNIYFREDRIRGVFFMKKKGITFYYANSPEHPHFTEILNKWRRDYAVRSIRLFTRYAPDFIMYFPKYTGKIAKEYSARKDENITKVLERGKEEFAKPPEEKWMLGTDVAKLCNVTPNTVNIWKMKGILKTVPVGLKDVFLEKDVLELLKTRPRKGYHLRKEYKEAKKAPKG